MVSANIKLESKYRQGVRPCFGGRFNWRNLSFFSMRLLKLFGFMFLLLVVGLFEGRNITAQTNNESLIDEFSISNGFRFHGQWTLEVGGELFDEEVDQGTLVGFVFHPRVRYRLQEAWDLYVDGKLQLVSRQIQARFSDTRQTGIIPYEAVVRFQPTDQWEIKVGTLGMNYLETPLFLSNEKSFPGVMETFRLKWGVSYLRLLTMQALPTSSSFESMRTEREPIPTLTTETLQAGWLGSGLWELTGRLTHFRFSPLPSIVAFESSRMGNNIVGDLPATSHFMNGFDGWIWGSEVCFCYWNSTQIRLGGYQLQNNEAISGFNHGQEILLRGDFDLGGAVAFSPYHFQFFNEADTSPAYYNSGLRGHNNRQGQGFGLELLLRSYNFRLRGEYIESDVINPNPLQRKLNSVQVRLETLNVEF